MPLCRPSSLVRPPDWWNERDSNPHLPLARRGLSQLSYHPVVPGVGFEPTSPRLQHGAFTRLASQASLLLPFFAEASKGILLRTDGKQGSCEARQREAGWSGRRESNSRRLAGDERLCH